MFLAQITLSSVIAETSEWAKPRERIWQEQQFSVFLITHDVDEAVTLADRVLLIEQGRITLDKPVSLPCPRQRKSQAFITWQKKF